LDVLGQNTDIAAILCDSAFSPRSKIIKFW
jgi:hypothetical protein